MRHPLYSTYGHNIYVPWLDRYASRPCGSLSVPHDLGCGGGHSEGLRDWKEDDTVSETDRVEEKPRKDVAHAGHVVSAL